MDLVADRSPSVDRPFQPELLHALHPAIERDPRHYLRVREVLARAAHLPDPLVRLGPDPLEMLDQVRLQRPARLVVRKADAPRKMERVHHLAEYVELELLRGGVTDAHRT